MINLKDSFRSYYIYIFQYKVNNLWTHKISSLSWGGFMNYFWSH